MFRRAIELSLGDCGTVKTVELDQKYEGDTGVVVCQDKCYLLCC